TDADRLGVESDDLISIKVGQGHSIEIPVYILWGQPQGVITLPLGYGRTAAGPIGGDVDAADATDPVGFDTYKVRKSGQMFVATGGVEVTKAGGSHELVSTQEHQQMDWIGQKGYTARAGTKGKSGSIIREATFAEYVAKPDFVDHVTHRLPLLQLWDTPYPSLEKQKEIAAKDPDAPRAFSIPHAWGMSIDMSACVGCNACVIACQSENNIPTVGKAMVKMNREMHWIRLDRYFKAKMDESRHVQDYENVDVTYQVMMCVHCENAPCEQVCPVAATVHDTEGLNTMVYNRCIGTRYCSNNCPYKVRRFNYMDWHSRNSRKGAGLELVASAWAGIPDTQQQQSIEQVRRMVYNPEVTVRMRGVMEKCTYCTQRIKAATINKKNEWAKGNLPQGEKANGQPGYTVDDFEVITACQQACSTQAITFGNLMDPTSAVRALHKVPRAYTVLEDLNTRARTKHLAKIRNQNEQLAEVSPAGTGEEGKVPHGGSI
ncbi:MAG: 4Fe-4S dicluster domain-containing protein, partial [Proteobacteria bacterium]